MGERRQNREGKGRYMEEGRENRKETDEGRGKEEKGGKGNKGTAMMKSGWKG